MVTPELVLEHVEKVFLKRLVSAIKKEIKIIKQKKYVQIMNVLICLCSVVSRPYRLFKERACN